MKDLIGGIQRFSTEDGPGIRTTVFFNGCPLDCQWCHNPELISREPQLLYTEQKCIACGECMDICSLRAIQNIDGKIEIDRQRCNGCGDCAEQCCTEAIRLSGKQMDIDALLKILKSDKGFYARTGGGVTLSGGEVTTQTDYAYIVQQKCLANGINVTVDTCGYCRYEDLKKLADAAQVILYDIKSVDDTKHKELTAVSNKLILDNLRALCKEPKIKDKIIIRLPLIHGTNDTKEDLTKVCDLLDELDIKSVEGLPYHSLGISKSRKIGRTSVQFETPPDDYIDEIVDLFKARCMNIKIMGRDKAD